MKTAQNPTIPDKRFEAVTGKVVEFPGNAEKRGAAMKLIRTEDAAGHILCRDMTQIIKGEYKDARLRKGHKVTPVDIPSDAVSFGGGAYTARVSRVTRDLNVTSVVLCPERDTDAVPLCVTADASAAFPGVGESVSFDLTAEKCLCYRKPE